MNPTIKKYKPELDKSGRVIMSKKYLKALCLERELYSTPSLNEILYLHFHGFHNIENLDEYVNVCALFLENNLITHISGLDSLTKLRDLFLHSNRIEKIQNLDCLTNLVTLNLCNNSITVIEGLGSLKKLETLNLSDNRLTHPDQLVGLTECKSLRSIDLTKNNIVYTDKLLDIFIEMTNLACLYLKQNPLVNDFPDYRKKLTCIVKTLQQLDDRSVTADDRRLALAWLEKGKDGVTLERLNLYNEKENAKGKPTVQLVDLQKQQEEAKNDDMESSEDDETQTVDLVAIQKKRIEQEFAEKKAELVKKKDFLVEREPMGYRVMVVRIDAEIEKLEKEHKSNWETLFGIKKVEQPSSGQSESAAEDTRKELKDYLEKKNLFWLVENSPSVSSVKITTPERASIDNQAVDSSEKSQRSIQNNNIKVKQVKEFRNAVDMMEDYLNNLDTEGWTLDTLLQAKEFVELYHRIQKIHRFLNSQDTVVA